jgi:hypothetical protein
VPQLLGPQTGMTLSGCATTIGHADRNVCPTGYAATGGSIVRLGESDYSAGVVQ